MENKFYSGHWKSYLQYYNFIFVFAVPTPEQVNPPEGMVIFQDSIFEEKRMTLFLFPFYSKHLGEVTYISQNYDT